MPALKISSAFEFIIFLFCCSTVFAAGLTTIAVFDLDPQGIPKHEASLISEKLRSSLLRTGLFKVMERGQMETILKEQGFQQSGACSEASCVVQVGQMLAVSKMVAGSVGKIGSMYILNVKLIDVTSGEILIALEEQVTGKIEDVFVTAVPQLAGKLAKEIDNTKPKVGFLNVTSQPAGALIVSGDKTLGTTPVKGVELEIGEHKISASLKDYITQERTIAIAAEQVADLDFALSHTEEYLQKQKEKSAAKRSGFLKFARYACAAVAVAGLGGAGYLHYDWMQKNKDYKATTDPVKATSLHSKIVTIQNNRTIMLIAGGAGAVGLGVTYVF